MKYSRKEADFWLTHTNVNSEERKVPLVSQDRHWGTWLPPRWHWGWNCTQCTLHTSSPPHRKLGSREVFYKVHLVQFQLNFTWVHVWVDIYIPCDFLLRPSKAAWLQRYPSHQKDSSQPECSKQPKRSRYLFSPL